MPGYPLLLGVRQHLPQQIFDKITSAHWFVEVNSRFVSLSLVGVLHCRHIHLLFNRRSVVEELEDNNTHRPHIAFIRVTFTDYMT